MEMDRPRRALQAGGYFDLAGQLQTRHAGYRFAVVVAVASMATVLLKLQGIPAASKAENSSATICCSAHQVS